MSRLLGLRRLFGMSEIVITGATVLRPGARQDGPLARSQRMSSRRLHDASGWTPRVRAGTDTWGRIAA